MSNLLTAPAQRPQFLRSISATSQLSNKSSKSLLMSRTFSHQKDKLRIYLAVFPRGGSYGSQLNCDSYHWAIVVGPKSPLRSEAGKAYHVVHSSSDFLSTPYLYEETDLAQSPHHSRNILARVAIAKILDEDRVLALLRTLAADTKNLSGKDSEAPTDNIHIDLGDFSCLTFVKSAWETISDDSQRPLKSYFGPNDWDDIEARARKYVKRKRVQGRFSAPIEAGNVTWNPTEIPTWNYWENRETTD